MYIRAVSMLPKYVEGRIFTERTLIGKYKDYDLRCTTVFMNDKPIGKQWEIKGDEFTKSIWKGIK